MSVGRPYLGTWGADCSGGAKLPRFGAHLLEL